MRNLLSVLALAALVGALPGTALAQRRPRRPAPPPSKDVLKHIDQRLDRLERTLKSLAATMGRLYRMNYARDVRIRRLESAVRKLAASKTRHPAGPLKKPSPRKHSVRKSPTRRPAPPRAHRRVFSFGGKLSPEARKRIAARVKEAMKKMPPERRERIKAFLKKIKERKERAEKGERGERKGWSPLRVRGEKERREGREHSFRFFSPEKIREFARKHPQLVRMLRRMRAMRAGDRSGFHGPTMGRSGASGRTRHPMMRERGMGMHRGRMGSRGRCGMGRCMHGRERMGRRPRMPFHGRYHGFHRPAGPRPPMGRGPGRTRTRVRPSHQAGPKGRAPMRNPRIFFFRKGHKASPHGFKAMAIERVKKGKSEAGKSRHSRRSPKGRMEHHRKEHHRKGPKVKKAGKSRFHSRRGHHESKERKGPRRRRHGKLV